MVVSPMMVGNDFSRQLNPQDWVRKGQKLKAQILAHSLEGATASRKYLIVAAEKRLVVSGKPHYQEAQLSRR